MLSFFTALTADDRAISLFVDGGPTATDPDAGFAGVVLGCEPDADAFGLTPAQAFVVRDAVPMFERSELWALVLAVREGGSSGTVLTRAHRLLAGDDA